MRSKNKLLLLITILSIWLIFVVFASYFLIETDTQLIGLALIIFTVVLTMTQIFRFSGWLAAIAAIAIYGAVEISLKSFTPNVYYPIGYFAFATLVTTFLATLTVRELNNLNFTIENNQKLIDELRLYDPLTGLMRYQQALRLLKAEIIRSQRFKRNLCLLLIKVRSVEEADPEFAAHDQTGLNRQIADAITSASRASDIPFKGNYYGLILPETVLEGAKIVIDRISTAIANKVRLACSIGIAQFPEDGMTEIELSGAAETALILAAKTEKPYVQYDQSVDVQNGAEAVINKLKTAKK